MSILNFIKEIKTENVYHETTENTKYGLYYDAKTVFEQLQIPMSHLILDGGVGTGKTSFVLELMEHFEMENYHCFWLCNRKALKQQMIRKVNTVSEKCIFNEVPHQHLNIESYQSFQSWKTFEIRENEKYVFAFDECHYILEDARFNTKTYEMLKFIEHNQDKCTFIFMSATAKELFDKLIKSYFDIECTIYRYTIKDDFRHINQFYYYSSSKDMLDIIQKTNKKSIIFSNDMKTWRTIVKTFSSDDLTLKQSEYEPEKNNKNWLQRKGMIECSKGKYIKDEKGDIFTSHIFLTTSAYDNGINISIHDIENVFIEFDDIYSMAQALGRVRSDMDNPQLKINVFFKIKSYQKMKDYCHKYLKTIKEEDYTDEQTVLEAIKENEALSDKIRHDLKLISSMLSCYENHYQNKHKYWINVYQDLWFKKIVSGQKVINIKKWKPIEQNYPIIDELLDKDLKSKDIKDIAKNMKWKNEHREDLTVNDTIAKLESLGYIVEIEIKRKVKHFMIKK